MPAEELTLTGSVPEIAAAGGRIIGEWTVQNEGPSAVATSFYLHSGSAPIARFACRGGRTQTGRCYASAALSLAPGAAARIVALIGPVKEGQLLVRATAVSKDRAIQAVHTIRVETADRQARRSMDVTGHNALDVLGQPAAADVILGIGL